jgi:hypothetical protein
VILDRLEEAIRIRPERPSQRLQLLGGRAEAPRLENGERRLANTEATRRLVLREPLLESPEFKSKHMPPLRIDARIVFRIVAHITACFRRAAKTESPA